MLRNIHEEKGLTIFLIEHVIRFVMPISKRVLVLDSTKKIEEGKPEEIAQTEGVIEAYLGEKYVKSK